MTLSRCKKQTKNTKTVEENPLQLYVVPPLQFFLFSDLIYEYKMICNLCSLIQHFASAAYFFCWKCLKLLNFWLSLPSRLLLVSSTANFLLKWVQTSPQGKVSFLRGCSQYIPKSPHFNLLQLLQTNWTTTKRIGKKLFLYINTEQLQCP